MSYTGAVNLGELGGTGNGTNRKDLFQDYYLETLEAFTRMNIGQGLIMSQSIPSGKAAEFIVGQFSDGTDTNTHTAGTQISVTDQAFDQRLIVIDDVEYTAKRIDSFEEAMAHYPTRQTITNFMGETLAKFVDKKIFSTVAAAAVTTGKVGNPDGVTVTNAVIASATAPAAIGNAIADSIFDAVAKLRVNDNANEPVVVVDPINYSYLVRADRMVDGDFTSGNGGLDSGTIKMCGGAKVYQSNNLPATANLEALVFTREAAGMVTLQGLKTESNYQEDFFADLLTARLGVGYGVLRPECACVIMSA